MFHRLQIHHTLFVFLLCAGTIYGVTLRTLLPECMLLVKRERYKRRKQQSILSKITTTAHTKESKTLRARV